MIVHELTHARRQHFHAAVLVENRQIRRAYRDLERVQDKWPRRVVALIGLVLVLLTLGRML